MNRRDFLATAYLATLSIHFSKTARSRPLNIILVEHDSWDSRVLGCLGFPGVERATRNIDGPTRRGVLFRNRYCSHPICCPSRANTWSGKYTQHIESWNKHEGLPINYTTFKTYLERAGYHFGGFGKFDYLSVGHTVFNRVAAWTGHANIQLPQLRTPPPLILDSDQPNPKGGGWLVVASAKAFFRNAASGSRPFLLYVGLEIPHPPFVTSRKWLRKVNPDAVTILPEDEELHPVMAYQRIAKNWEWTFALRMIFTTRAIYCAMCAEADAMMGEILNDMDRLQLGPDTYFIVTSGHGENALAHRQYYKMNVYESSAKVPLLVAGPEIPRGSVINNIVSLIDIFPTLLDIGDFPRPNGIDGESLLPLMKRETCTNWNWAYAMFSVMTSNTTMYMLRKGNWKYIAYPSYEPQLFNLVVDPHEIRNFAKQRPEVAKILDAELRNVVDCDNAHKRVIEYDASSFTAWRQSVRRQPIPFHAPDGRHIKPATYDECMTNFYPGWSPTYGQQLDHRLKNTVETAV